MTQDNTQLAVSVQPQGLSVSMLPVDEMRPLLAEYEKRRSEFRVWLRNQMTEGVHYGYPPGCKPRNTDQKQYKDRPSLYKAGADLCCDLLKMRPVWEPDMDSWKMGGSKDGTFYRKCKLINDGSPFFIDREIGEVLGEGCGAGTIGAKSADANKAIKDAQKRAKVDAVLNTLGLSDLFTQDIEDMVPQANEAPDADASAPRVAPRAQRQNECERVTAKMLTALRDQYVTNGGEGRISEFAAKLTNTDAERYTSPAGWTIDVYNMVLEAIR